MPYLGAGSPNMSKMKPELVDSSNDVPHYHPLFAEAEDDAQVEDDAQADDDAQAEDDASSTSSTAAVAEYVGYSEEKKRSAAGEDDENPGVTKKIKAAASSSHNTSLASPLPNIVLNMKTDKNYAEFMQSHKQVTDMDGGELEKIAGEALQELKTKFNPVDTNGHPMDGEAALQSKSLCIL
jgi:hypothetical protein